MIDVLTAADVRAQDAAAEQAGTPVEILMERAGWAVARAARGMLGGCYGRRVVVVAGKGNNGGDGIVAARVLLDGGAHVTVLAPDAPGPLAARNLERFRGRLRGYADATRELGRADLVIDALLGVGISRPLDGAIASLVSGINTARAPVLAVDMPTGVNADTGGIAGDAVRADRTVTFAGLKPGLLFEPGASCTGEVEVASIGTPPGVGVSARALVPADVLPSLPARGPGANKRSVGTILVVAGSAAMPGAAALTVGASVHAGAGLTVLCAPDEVCRIVVERVPEITTIPAPTTGDGTIDPKVLDALMPRLGEFHGIALGPGLSRNPATAEFVRALLGATDMPVVLDADGLSAFAGATDDLRARDGFTLLTPHAGELARLLDRPVADVEADRLSVATGAARELRCAIVFKGPGTVITDGDRTYINLSGGAALAQGGTGDVLTGMAAAFIGRRGEAGDRLARAAAAVAVHGMAADRIAARIAPQPAHASPLIDELGPTMHDVLHG